MKNVLQIEIIKNLKKLGLSQQYNVLDFTKNIEGMPAISNRILGFPVLKDQAMNEIRLALVLGPEKIDF